MLVFLKLGGSLITDKNKPHTPRGETLTRLSAEIAAAIKNDPGLSILVGHGSGSFGHVAGHKHGTRKGVNTGGEWLGFAEVWSEARALNQLVMESLYSAGLPVMAFPPSAGVITCNGQVVSWDIQAMKACLQSGLIPVIQGDVVFDICQGGTILSTEECFGYLAPLLHPERILLAGMEPGVWADFPTCHRLLQQITPADFRGDLPGVEESRAIDVTGGMQTKVMEMLKTIRKVQGLKALIFSGEKPGTLQRALAGENPGTLILS